MIMLEQFMVHRAYLYKYACKLTLDKVVAEDVLQDTFLRLRNVRELPQNPKAYLVSALRSAFFNRRRNQVEYVPFLVELKCERENAESILIDKQAAEQTSEMLCQHISELPKKRREVLTALLADEGPREYARRTGKNMNSVLTHYKLGVKQLRSKLVGNQ